MESRYLIIPSTKVDDKGKSVFIPLKGNRKYKASPYLIESLREDKQVYPVICFENNPGYYLIVDGQHRLDGLKKLNAPVELKIYRKTDPSENELEFIDKLIRSANSTSKNWNNSDHLNWNVKFNSDPTYKRFKELKDSYKHLDINFLYTALRKEEVIKGYVNQHIKERKLSFDMMVDEQTLKTINDLTKFVVDNFKNDKNFSCRKQLINFALYKFSKTNEITTDRIMKIFSDENNYNKIYILGKNADSVYDFIISNY